MPVYLFEHKKTGKKLEKYYKLGEVKVPRGYVRVYDVGMSIGVGVRDAHNNELVNTLTNDYKSYEERNGGGSIERDLGMSPDKIKKEIKEYASTFAGQKYEGE